MVAGRQEERRQAERDGEGRPRGPPDHEDGSGDQIQALTAEAAGLRARRAGGAPDGDRSAGAELVAGTGGHVLRFLGRGRVGDRSHAGGVVQLSVLQKRQK